MFSSFASWAPCCTRCVSDQTLSTTVMLCYATAEEGTPELA